MMPGETNLQGAVLSILATAEAPMTAREIATAIGADANETSKRISNLVGGRDVHRHHSMDGLTYSVTEQGLAKVEKRAKGSLSERIRALLRLATRPLSLGDIEAALNDAALPRESISGTLAVLVTGGHAFREGPKGGSTWSLRKPVSPPAPSSAQEGAPTGPAPVATEPPAPPRTPVATDPPHAAHVAAPETLKARVERTARDMTAGALASLLARDIEHCAREMASECTDPETLAELISCVAHASRLDVLLNTRGAA